MRYKRHERISFAMPEADAPPDFLRHRFGGEWLPGKVKKDVKREIAGERFGLEGAEA